MKRLSATLALLFCFSILPPLGSTAPVIKDLIVKESPYVDARAFMDGLSGRPTLTAWKADQVNGSSPTVDALGAIQAAVDYALQNHINKVYLSDGFWKITGPIHLGYGEAFTEVALEGAGRMFNSWAGASGTSIIATSFSNAPAIVIQGGRNTQVRKLSIRGASTGYATGGYLTAISAGNVSWDNVSTATNWVSGVTANGLTRYAPYAGIAIDAYSGVRPATSYPDVSYPAWTGITTQYGKAFTSGVKIEDVEIEGFFVAVAQTPADSDGNGDFLKYLGGQIGNCAYAFSIGQTQSRNVTVRDIETWGVHTFITNNQHGRRAGTIVGTINNISGGPLFQLYDIGGTAQSGPINFDKIYVESLVRIGKSIGSGSSNEGINIESSLLAYIGLTPERYNVPIFVGYVPISMNNTKLLGSSKIHLMTSLSSGAVIIKNCSWYNNWDITDNNYKLASNWMVGGLANLHRDSRLIGRLQTGRYSSLPSPMPDLGTNDVTDTVQGRAQINAYSRYVRYSNGATKLLEKSKNPGLNPISAPWPMENMAFDNSTLVMTFTYNGGSFQAVNSTHIEPGTILWNSNMDAMFVVDNVTANTTNWDISATMVTNYQINASSEKVPIVAFDNTAYFHIYQTFNKVTGYQWRGNVTAGSDNVTNVRTSDGLSYNLSTDFKVGDVVFSDSYMWDNYLPMNAKIIALGASGGSPSWIQLDTVATDNGTSVPIELYR